MNTLDSIKTEFYSAAFAALLSASALFAQGPNADHSDFDSAKDTVTSVDGYNKIERLSRTSYQGRDPNRPYSAFYVTESIDSLPLISKNEHAVIHMASITKLTLAMAYYYCRDRAFAEASSPDDLKKIRKKFEKELPYLKQAIVHSDNKQAHRIGLFLENLNIDFINCGIEELGIKRGHYRVFSKIIIPEVLKPLGLKETRITNPSGLPPYDFRFFPRRERPFNFRGSAPHHYRDPDDYNVSTAYEVAKIVEAAVKSYPELYQMTRIRELWNTADGEMRPNVLTLLENSLHEKAMPIKGFDFGKTGTTRGAGSAQAGSALREIFGDSARLYIVDAGHWKWLRDQKRRKYKAANRRARDEHSQKLIDSAYRLIERKKRMLTLETIQPKGAVLDTNSLRLKPIFDHQWDMLKRNRRLRRLAERSERHKNGQKGKFGFLNKIFVRREPREIVPSAD